jgi:SAM-dependent methyltransferase
MYNPRIKSLTDTLFDLYYPEHIQRLSRRHWSPVVVAEKAATFLADGQGNRILDIGSGVGKFCIAGAQLFPNVQFYGVEQRESLYNYAMAAKNSIGLQNVHFIHDNFTHIDMDAYDHFYFYNSFFENIDEQDRIDHDIAYSASLYTYYTRYLYSALDKRPRGTRLVTFHSLEDEVPPSYRMVHRSDDLVLKMWIKQ